MRRKTELAITYSLDEQGSIAAALAAERIPYQINTVHRNSPNFMGSSRVLGTYSQDLELSCEYIFYVSREDLLQARQALAHIG